MKVEYTAPLSLVNSVTKSKDCYGCLWVLEVFSRFVAVSLLDETEEDYPSLVMNFIQNRISDEDYDIYTKQFENLGYHYESLTAALNSPVFHHKIMQNAILKVLNETVVYEELPEIEKKIIDKKLELLELEDYYNENDIKSLIQTVIYHSV